MTKSNTIDSYEQFFDLVSKEQLFEFGLKNIISIEKSLATDIWTELKNDILQKVKNKLYVRSSGRDGKGNNLLIAMYKEVFGIDIEIDKTNNAKPTQLLVKATGYRKNKTIFNYQVSHVFGLTKNVYCFTAPWNIVFIPKIIDPFTGHEAKGAYVNEFQSLFKKYIYEEYKELIDDYNCMIRKQYPAIKAFFEREIQKDPKRLNDYLKDFQEIDVLNELNNSKSKENIAITNLDKKGKSMKGKRKGCKVVYNGSVSIYNAMNRTVLGVMKTICENHKYTESELRLVFPDSVAKEVESGFSGFATVFIEIDKANEHDFFIEEPIKIKNKVIAISKQWNSSNFRNFIAAVKKSFDIDITDN